MAVTVERKYNGDSGTRFKDWSLQYLVRGTNDSIEAMNEAWTAAPATINTASAPIILNGCQVRPIQPLSLYTLT